MQNLAILVQAFLHSGLDIRQPAQVINTCIGEVTEYKYDIEV